VSPSPEGSGGSAPGRRIPRRRLLWVERLLLAAGTILLTVYAVARIDGWKSSSAALRAFDQTSVPLRQGEIQRVGFHPGPSQAPDFSLWSPQRIKAFAESLWLTEDQALAVIEMDRPPIRVPVFEGTDDLILNRGAGFIPGTARPGEDGNIAIAGHRDGFFRGLMFTQVGDSIRLRAADKVLVYRVDGTEIVDPEHVEILKDRIVPSLTLITCYPFYYIGSAPQRFIVHATLQSRSETED
jgi:sortase A